MAPPLPLRVLVTGAAGQIGYSLIIEIARGDAFGNEQPLSLMLYDLLCTAQSLEGAVLEIQNCALPTLQDVKATADEKEAFTNIDYAFLVGAMPRKQGMERKDLLAANVKIFKNSRTGTGCLCKTNNKASNFSALTRLDHNRAVAQIALKCGVTAKDVKNVIWGNHSNTQYPDAKHATITKDGNTTDALSKINDPLWLTDTFLTNEWVSMAVASDGSYGIPNGLIFSFPVTITDGKWKIVQGLEWDAHAKGKIAVTQKELNAMKHWSLVKRE